ncbi:MAG TPA: histidine phosphatase family protein [Polyangiaceae bacterium]|jgi:broad specificity phosphatase PhoE|nr:histidine phosphatase family protein [Polyangiaceae bacterium]
MTIYLVRHGRAEAGVEHPDPGLDEIGRSQAERAAEALKKLGTARLICSPLRRARETAAPIAAALGLTPEIRDEVAEVFDPSMAIGARRDMLIPLLSGRWSEQSEPLRRWRDRVLAALVALGSEKAIVVSHFVAISAAIGASTDDDRVSPCALANASITTMEVVNGKLDLRRPGEVSHLSRDEITASHAMIGQR